VRQPLVSVVIPSCNSAPFIDETLQSVADQTYSNLEVLVADDGSTDGTLERIRSMADRLPLRVLPSSDRAGRPSVPRNRALRVATGELVAFLDADDLWTRTKIEHQVQAMMREPDLVLVYSILRAFGSGVRFASSSYGLKPWPGRAACDAASLERANTIPCSSVMVRRSTLVALGGFDEDPELAAVEDFDLWVRISRVGPIGFIPRIHGFYRVHDRGLSRDSALQRRRAEYLVAKRQLTGFTFREFRTRSVALCIARNTADILATAWLRAADQFDSRMSRRVPIHRGAMCSSIPA